MLPKSRRISRHLFPDDPRSGVVFHAPHLSLRFVARGGVSPRVSVVVPKRAVAKASDRHTVKRRVYDAVERYTKIATPHEGMYVFFAKKEADTIPYAQLRAQVEELIGKTMQSIVMPKRLV